jgi:hypothetical protein
LASSAIKEERKEELTRENITRTTNKIEEEIDSD